MIAILHHSCQTHTSNGTHSQRFLGRTIVLGTAIAIFFLFTAWIPRGLITVTGKIRRSARTERGI
jgi:hypothetical protein